MAFRDLADVIGVAEPKTLPIHGQNVTFPGRISARVGALLLILRRAAATGGKAALDELTDSGEITEADALSIEDELLGDGAKQLEEIGVRPEERRRVVETLMAWHLAGREAAEDVWEGKAAPPNRAARRKTAGKSSKTGGRGSGHSATGDIAFSAPRPKGAKPGSGSQRTSAS